MKRNEALYSYRLSRGLSRSLAAEMLGISVTLLRNYEEGYIYLKDDIAKKLALSYGLEEGAFLLDDKGYIGAISYDKEKPIKEGKGKKVKDFFASLPMTVVGIAMFIIFLVTAIEGIVSYRTSYDGRWGYMPSYYNEIVTAVRLEGEETNISLYGSLMDDSEAIGYKVDDVFIVRVPKNDNVLGMISFSCQYESSGLFYLECYSSGYSMASYEPLGASEVVSIGIATYNNSSDSLLYTLTPGDTKSAMETCFPLLKEKINAYLASYEENIKTADLFAALEQTNVSLSSMRIIAVQVIFLGGIGVSLALFILIFGMVVRSQRKETVYRRVENLFAEEGVTDSLPTRELPPSFHPAPFIFKEDYLRVIFLILFFIGGLNSVISAISSSFIYTSFYAALTEILPYFTGIATFMIFFLKLEAIISRRNTLLSFLTCLAAGFLFYIGEVYISLLLSGIGKLGELLAHSLPSNMFTGLAALALFAFFLLKEPIKAKRWQRNLFHSFALLPLAYLLIGFIMLGSGESYGPFVTGALNGGLFEVSVVGVSYIIFLFISRKVAFSRYGRENGEIYLSGNKFCLLRNIFLSIMVLVVVISAYILPSSVSLWSLEQDKYLLVLIPFFLLYRPRYPKSTLKGEVLFDASYFVLLALPYLFTGLAYLIKR